jgi:hypothetical protein
VEWITIILSSLVTLVSPVGIVADQVAEGLIREQLYQADLVDVRIDSAPNFQFAGGRVDRVRVAGRGVYPIPELRIDTVDLETDPINIDLAALQSGRFALDEPFQAATHVILKADDINTVLRSQRVQTLLDTLRFSLPGTTEREENRYGLANPQIEFLTDNRLQVTVELQDRVEQESVTAVVETGLQVVDGHQLVLLNPQIAVDGQPVPQALVTSFTRGVNSELTLKQLEGVSVVARVLQFSLSPDAVDAVLYVRVDPESRLLQSAE